ncbi:hypothetical protein [Aureispira sp. CCB-QB1]|uniref:hypothetical protein n=1 Tax=Aureispira sp. CCB-QB1 TaxID=1313421 RepID=UPI000698E085|nr:hypothetical protein [Aureispira sp. CCB-QB1]
MIIDPEDYSLVRDYINTIKAQEAILWEGRMIPLEVKNTLFKDEILLIINLILLLIGISIATFLIHIGLTIIILSILLGAFLFILQQRQKDIQQNKLKYSKYLITSKQCILVHWYQQQIHINAVSAKSIKQVQTHRNTNGEIAVLFHTKQAINFEMSYFIDDKNTDFIGFINIGNQANRVTKIIREHLLQEK